MGSSAQRLPRPYVFMLVLTMILAAFAIATEPTGHAQVERDGPTARYTVTVNLCLAPGCTELAEAITPADGIAVTVSDADTGEVFSSCVTGADGPGACTVDIRLVPMLAFTFDESTLPEGYVLDSNPQLVPNQLTEPGEHAELDVLLYPAGGFQNGVTSPVPVRAMICGDASCAAYVENIYGVEVTAVDTATGAVIDSCVTDAGNQIGGCALAIPDDVTFRLTFDEAAIPEGLVSYGEPIREVILSGGVEGYTLAFFAPERDAPVPTPTADAPAPPVRNPGELPAGLHAGTCGEGEIGVGAQIVALNGPLVPDGPPNGSSAAIPVGVGFTVVDIPFADLLADDHAIAIFAAGDAPEVLACGAIGGVLDANGALSIGLAPAADTGAVGVAYLSPQDDGTATGISLFLPRPPEIEEGTPAA